jgi:TatD DNase family protein
LHCCEPDTNLLTLATGLGLYIGVDGDVTYSPEKQDFIRQVPLEILVLETDAPYLLPEPLKTAKKYPNTPATIPLIAQAVAELKGTSIDEVGEITTRNAQRLFDLPK